MKNLTLITLLLVTFAFTPIKDKDPCRKVFKKEKKRKKASSFDNQRKFATRGIIVDNSHARKIILGFDYYNDTTHLSIHTVFVNSSLSLKRKFSFNANTVFAFVFEDGTSQFVTMEGVDNQTYDLGNWTNTTAKIVLDEKILQELTYKTVTSIEILNPFGYSSKNSVIHTRILKTKESDLIKSHSSCFLNRI